VPPALLLTDGARRIWGPLAILDYGNQPKALVPGMIGEKLPIGANLAFRRSALAEIGGWRTDLGKVDNTLISGEDHEVFYRLERAGLFRGLYDPANVVHHWVPASRMTRRYFRRWFFWHGKTLARMSSEIYGQVMAGHRVPHIAGAPRFFYRQTLELCARYVTRWPRRNPLDRFITELETIECLGFLAQAWSGWRHEGRNVTVAPVAPFATSAVPNGHTTRARVRTP
jgi:hypothetical protein